MKNEIDDKILKLSADKIFYTLEGEGKFAGRPSIFMRLSQCNLTCPAFISPSSPHGCDSYTSWSVINKTTFSDVFEMIKPYVKYLERGALLKITGGEPLLWQSQIIKFLYYLRDGKTITRINVDFETNGTIIPQDELKNQFNVSYTVSPKLESSGNTKIKRYNPDALAKFSSYDSCFKFVVQTDSDIQEIYDDFIDNPAIQLNSNNIWLMPCCGNRQEQNERALWVAEKCKEHNFKFSPRLHLMIWDMALRV